MSKEAEIKSQLIGLGIYDEAFDPKIHELCIQRRELSRMRKQFKAEGSDYTGKLHDRIDKKVALIAQLEFHLGLDPSGYAKLQRKSVAQAATEAAPIAGTSNQGFAALMDRIKEASHAGK